MPGPFLPEKTMRKSMMLFVLVFEVLLTGVHAATRQSYQSATVVNVTNHESLPSYVGNPVDGPSQPEVYSYDIGIQLDCTVYVVRYETGLDYLPSVFSPHQTVEVSLQKHIMYVSLPGAGEVKLGIGKRTRVKDASCTVNN
jgi:hypothetical protein